MAKKLTKHGNSLAVVIDKPILDLLKIDADTPLELTTDGISLVISPTDAEHRRKFKAAMARVQREWASVFKKLAE